MRLLNQSHIKVELATKLRLAFNEDPEEIHIVLERHEGEPVAVTMSGAEFMDFLMEAAVMAKRVFGREDGGETAEELN